MILNSLLKTVLKEVPDTFMSNDGDNRLCLTFSADLYFLKSLQSNSKQIKKFYYKLTKNCIQQVELVIDIYLYHKANIFLKIVKQKMINHNYHFVFTIKHIDKYFFSKFHCKVKLQRSYTCNHTFEVF